MAQAIDREETYQFTVPALTAKETPRVEPTYFNPGTVVQLEIVIPDGHAGLTGLRISSNGARVYPTNTGAWLVGNSEVIKRDIYNWPNSGRLELEAYNEDRYAHTFTVRYAIAENPLPAPEPEKTSAPIATSATGEAITEPAPTETVPTTQPTEPAPTETPSSPEAPPSESPEKTTPAPEPKEAPAAPEPTPEVPASAEPEPTLPVATPEAPAAPEIEPPLEAPAEPEAEPSIKFPKEAKLPASLSGKKVKRKRATKGAKKTVTVTETRPAGGWLPKGARFTKERTDQGQDFITDWKGRVVAPASGTVVHILKDKAFPTGFGPHYAVVHIDSGRFGGKDWYIGHCTAVVSAGQKFNSGDTLAVADQGHVSGGGWVELGEAPGGYPGPMGTGARNVGLFTSVTTHTKKKVSAAPAKRKRSKSEKAAKGKKVGKVKRAKPKAAKAKKPAKVKRVKAAKAPRAKKVPRVKAARVKKAKPPKAPRQKRVKPAKAPRPQRVKAAAAPAPKRKKHK